MMLDRFELAELAKLEAETELAKAMTEYYKALTRDLAFQKDHTWDIPTQIGDIPRQSSPCKWIASDPLVTYTEMEIR